MIGRLIVSPGKRPTSNDPLGRIPVLVDELWSVVRIDPDDREPEHRGDVLKGLKDLFSNLVFGTDRFTVHPVAMTVIVRVK